MKKVLTIVIMFVMLFVLNACSTGLDTKEEYIFEKGTFEAVDGWYVGEIIVGRPGNIIYQVDVTWEGEEGNVIIAPRVAKINGQVTAVLDVKIQQTIEEQSVVFTLTTVDGQEHDITIIVPPLYSGEILFDVLRTSINPGYYFSGVLIDMGVTLTSTAIDKDTFSAIARVTEYNGDVQGSFGNFAWDPEKEDYALRDGWAKWNIVDVYVADAEGNKVDKGKYVKIDIEWGTRTEPNGSQANRYDVPATRAAWYTGPGGLIAYATIEVDLMQNKEIPGIAEASYVQDETKHDPLFDQFEILDEPGGGTYSLYIPDNASENNKRPILVWFHGTGERYFGDNPGGNLIGNRILAFADEEFQEVLGGCYILAPQSTTAGWSASRLEDMETLINTIVSENYVDTNKIYVGGLSMGTGMTIPLITSTTENKIDYAAAILCSGGNINADQAQIIADKGMAVYLVGSTSDWAAFGLTPAFNNLSSAGVDVKLKMYPEGPVFDGEYYYGAHDAWNYIYNNLVEDESGETIFEWLARQSL
jgi:dienelactone hydrolase